jgi:thiol-disulfide isomerase/thioredoxin
LDGELQKTLNLFMRLLPSFLLLFIALSGTLQAQQATKMKITDLETRLKQPDTVFIINFWATWCGPCVAELPGFNRIDSAYAGKPVKVILVSLDFPEAFPDKLNKFLNDKKIHAQVCWLDESDANYFIPKVSNSWSGAIPATLVSCSATNTREFLEKKLSYEDLDEKIKKAVKK